MEKLSHGDSIINLYKQGSFGIKMALKDWKRTGKDIWRNRKNNDKIVEINPYNKSYIIQTEKGFNADGLIEIKSSKVKALRSAKSYMRTH